MLTIERLQVLAELDDPSRTLGWASAQAAAGDESWAEWLRDYERGDALVVQLSTTLFAADGGAHVIESSNRGVFVETGIHPPRLEQQIADLAGHDLGPLAGELLRRGHRLAPYALEDMYVHVELGEELKAAIARPGSARRGYASVTGSAARASTA